ncbi:MAG: HTH domain-containing protein [Bacteroidota bacterium]|nr:HTH domain-containing protein [Bacteroidota bacterium]
MHNYNLIENIVKKMAQNEYETSIREALEMQVEALELKCRALETKLQAIEMMNTNVALLRSTREQYGDRSHQKQGYHSNERDALQRALEPEVRTLIEDKGRKVNKATINALVNIMLVLFERKNVTGNEMVDLTKASRVTIMRHLGDLKEYDLVTLDGSKRKGYYILTDSGCKLYERSRLEAGLPDED